MYHSGIPPLVAGATTFPPSSRGHNNPCLLQSRLRRETSRCFILPPEQGEVRRSRIGGGERSEPIRRMLCISHGTESKSRNADFISIAAERQYHNPRPKGPSNLRTLRPSGRSILRTFLFEAKKTPLSGSQSIKGRIVICLWYGRGRGHSCGGNGGGVRFPEWKEVPVPFPGWHRSASGRSGK